MEISRRVFCALAMTVTMALENEEEGGVTLRFLVVCI
jgi:hypothetical protein